MGRIEPVAGGYRAVIYDWDPMIGFRNRIVSKVFDTYEEALGFTRVHR